jgi:hypothetical protein
MQTVSIRPFIIFGVMALCILCLSLTKIVHADSLMEKTPSKVFVSADSITADELAKLEAKGVNWNTVYSLVKLNIKIWGKVGWEYGRYEALKKYGVDIGKYPGASKVTLDYIKKHSKKR